MLPILTGILLNSVPGNQRTVANSLANLCYNLFGYMPAPFIYGFICDLTGGTDSRYGMLVLMHSSIISIGMLFFAYYLKTSGKKGHKKSKGGFLGLRRLFVTIADAETVDADIAEMLVPISEEEDSEESFMGYD